MGLLLLGGGAAVFSLNTTILGFDGEARVVLVALAFGLVLAGLIYIFGAISGGHFNPAVTISMAISRRMPLRDVLPYLIAQVLGGLVGIGIVAGIAYGSTSAYAAAQSSALGSQCYSGMGAPASCGFSLASVFLLELVLTFFFVLVIQIASRSENQSKNLAPIVIGLTLLVANLVVDPGGWRLAQPDPELLPRPRLSALAGQPMGDQRGVVVLDRPHPGGRARRDGGTSLPSTRYGLGGAGLPALSDPFGFLGGRVGVSVPLLPRRLRWAVRSDLLGRRPFGRRFLPLR